MPNRIAVVDDFFHDPDAVREKALAAPLKRDPGRHKGQRSESFPLDHFFGQELLARALGLDPDGFGTDDLGAEFPLWPKLKGYSCVHLGVAGDPLVYHSDSQRWAACVYLRPNAPVEAGTSFFRSRAVPTVRSSDDVRRYEHPDAVERIVYGEKLLDRTAWEEVDRVGNVYNRLVAWDAHLVHAVSQNFGWDARTGRLSLLFFFD